MNRSVVAVMLAVYLGSTSVPAALACRSAGPDKHVGSVTAIDSQAATFTLRDAETGRSLTFQVAPELLERLKLNKQVVVRYREQDGVLTALEIDQGR